MEMDEEESRASDGGEVVAAAAPLRSLASSCVGSVQMGMAGPEVKDEGISLPKK